MYSDRRRGVQWDTTESERVRELESENCDCNCDCGCGCESFNCNCEELAMDTRKAILSRRTVQQFSTEPIPEGCVERALECAVRAPNHKLSNPWRFTRVGPKTREKIVEVGLGLKRAKARAKGSEFSEKKEEKIRAKLGNAPALVAVSQVREEDEFRAREDYAAIACAIENFMLSLWSEGVGSKWATGKVTRAPATYDALGIDSAKEELVAFLWVGHSSRELFETPRRPLEELCRTLP